MYNAINVQKAEWADLKHTLGERENSSPSLIISSEKGEHPNHPLWSCFFVPGKRTSIWGRHYRDVFLEKKRNMTQLVHLSIFLSISKKLEKHNGISLNLFVSGWSIFQ